MQTFSDENIQMLFGVEDAENEDPDRLKAYFFRNKAYENLVGNLPIRILVGHKGVGKSALLKIAYLEDQNQNNLAIWLRPDDLRNVATSDNREFNSIIQEWKDGISEVILKKTHEAFISNPKEWAGGIFPKNADGLISAISSNLQKMTRKNLIKSTSQYVVDNFLANKTITVYMDDLDRGWEARKSDIKRISALLNAIRDIVGHGKSLKFRLGLRSDVYFLVRTSDESTDKIEQNIIWLTWSNHEILALMVKRIETFLGKKIDENQLLQLEQWRLAKYLDSVIEPNFNGSGKWHNAPIHRILLSLTRKRPRDLVKLLSSSAREAHKSAREIILTQDLKSVFESYSGERLQDIVNEFRSELPEVNRLLYGMRATKKERQTLDSYLYSNDQLIKKIKNIRESCRFRFTNGHTVTEKSLAEFLYKIDFITARRTEKNLVNRKYYDQSRQLQSQFVDFGFDWEVHPAYRWALQPESIGNLFEQIDLD